MSRMGRLAFSIVAAAMVIAFTALEARAQHSGGSFGGHAFHGGHHGSPSTHHAPSPSHGSVHRTTTRSRSPSRPRTTYHAPVHHTGTSSAGDPQEADDGPSVEVALPTRSRDNMTVLLGMLLAAVLGVGFYGARRRGALPPPGAQGWKSVDLTRVRVVVPPDRRAALQRALASRVRAASTSRRMVARLLRDTCDDLRGFEAEWLYGDVASYRPMSPPIAEARYRALTEDARAALVAGRPGAGEGVMLVTIVAASREEIPDVKPGRDGVTKVLRTLSRLPEDAIVALDVSWSPTRDDAHLSTMELEALHPDLGRLAP